MGLRTWRLEIDWRIQNRLVWSAPVLKRRLRDVARLLAGLDAAQTERYRALAGRYDLADWPRVCTAREYRLNLYVLDVLDRYLPRVAGGGRCLDIGAAAWSYLPALVSWSHLPWDGVELDAHRRYWTLATRRAHAEYMCRICPACRYRPGSLLDVHGRYRGITWFLPFVRPAPLAAARLPARFFQPQALLAHALTLLALGGQLLIVNQGEEEAAAQSALLTALGRPAIALGELTSVLSPFTQPRYGWLVAA